MMRSLRHVLVDMADFYAEMLAWLWEGVIRRR